MRKRNSISAAQLAIILLLLIAISTLAVASDTNFTSIDRDILQEQLQQVESRVWQLEDRLKERPTDSQAETELEELLDQKRRIEEAINEIVQAQRQQFQANATVEKEKTKFGIMYSAPRKLHFFSNRVVIEPKGYHLFKGDRVQLLDENYVTFWLNFHYGKVRYMVGGKVEEGWVQIGNDDEFWYWIKPDDATNPYR